jgi:ABC-2 type transport system ATP-binding protein
MYAIETFNLTKVFRKQLSLRELITSPLKDREVTTALKSVTIKVNKGELFGLIGPNGAGKTTLIKLLSTLIIPTEGSAVVNGYTIINEDILVRQSIGLVTGEERGFYWRLTGRQNLQFFAALYGISGHQADEKINNIFSLIELKGKEDIYVKNYSTGMRQKLSIGKALLNNPSVLFLDEPTNSLDPIASQHMRRFIYQNLVNEQGKTVLLTSHRLEEVEALCDKIAILDNGEIKFSGKLSDLTTKHSSFKKAFFDIISKEESTA